MRRASGFTLVELIIVIVLLAIVATISVRFVTFSTQGAVDTSDRQQRALAGVVISERISRELRNAFPITAAIRTGTFSSNECIEWLPIEAATNYLSLPSAPSSALEVVQFSSPVSVGSYLVVYGYAGSANLYADAEAASAESPISSPISSVGAGAEPDTEMVTLSQSHRFPTESPERRIYVVGEPVMFCQVGRFLYRYQGYDISSSIPGPGTPGGEVLAANLAESTLAFEVTASTLQRGAVVAFSFVLETPGSGETLSVSQEVQLRNVP